MTDRLRLHTIPLTWRGSKKNKCEYMLEPNSRDYIKVG